MGFFNPKSCIDDAEPEVCPVPQGGWSTRVNKLFLPAAKHVKTLYCYLRVSKVRVRVSQPLLNPNPNPSPSPSPNPTRYAPERLASVVDHNAPFSFNNSWYAIAYASELTLTLTLS